MPDIPTAIADLATNAPSLNSAPTEPGRFSVQPTTTTAIVSDGQTFVLDRYFMKESAE